VLIARLRNEIPLHIGSLIMVVIRQY